LFVAKLVAILAVVVLQLVLIVIAAAALGWRPSGDIVVAAGLVVIGVAAFAALGFTLAGALRAETNLAVANAVFLLFLLMGGVVVPMSKLPDTAAAVARILPAEPLAASLRASLSGASVDVGAVATLVAWTLVMSAVGALSFRWD
jgi:ABC-2 type transport system permease protein